MLVFNVFLGIFVAAESGGVLQLAELLLSLVQRFLQVLELLVELLLLLLKLFGVLFGGFGGLLGQLALALRQFLGFLDGVFHSFLGLEAFHKFNILIELLFDVLVFQFDILQSLLQLGFVHVVHQLFYLLHQLFHVVGHKLFVELFELTLLFHNCLALFAILLLELVVLLNLFLHLGNVVLQFFLLFGQLLEVFLVLPRKFLFVNEFAHQLGNFLLCLFYLRKRLLVGLVYIADVCIYLILNLLFGRHTHFEHLRTCRLRAVDAVVVPNLEIILYTFSER